MAQRLPDSKPEDLNVSPQTQTQQESTDSCKLSSGLPTQAILYTLGQINEV